MKSRKRFLTVFFWNSFWILFLLEIFGRLMFPGPPRIPIMEYDEYLGWKLIPNSEGELYVDGVHSRITINPDGFRDDPFQYDAVAEVFLLLGDSFSFGYGVSKEDGIEAHLERYLGKNAVWNLGVPGYSLDQNLLQLYQLEDGLKGKELKIRAVLVPLHTTDILSHMTNIGLSFHDGVSARKVYHKPMLFDAANGFHLPTEPVPPPEEVPARWQDTLKSRSGAIRLLSEIRHRILIKLGVRTAWGTEGRELPLYFKTFYAKHPSEELVTAWQATEQIILQIREWTRTRDAAILVILIPHKFELNNYGIDWESAKTEFDISADEYAPQYFWDMVHTFFAENNIPYVNLYFPFRGYLTTHPESHIYFPIDSHWNAEGHRLAAEAVYQELRTLLDSHR